MEAQRFPTDFDGILLSAPVHNITGVHTWGLWKARAFLDAGYIHPDKLELLASAIYGRCDEIDGVKDFGGPGTGHHDEATPRARFRCPSHRASIFVPHSGHTPLTLPVRS